MPITTVLDHVLAQTRAAPQATALWFEGRSTSYAQLDLLSSQCAQGLIAMGVAPGQRVAFLGKGCDEFFILWLGALKARACLAPVNWRLAPPEIAFILKDAGAHLLVCSQDFAEVAAGVGEACPELHHIIQVEAGHQRWPAFADWIAAQAAINPDLEFLAGDDVIQLYTSGTTGLPKGVQLTAANYEAVIASATGSWARYDAGDAVLVAMPLFHVAGTNMGMLGLVQGTKCVILREADPAAILRETQDHGVKALFLVPALINMILQHPAFLGTDLSGLENVFYGASPISEEVLRQAQAGFGAKFTQLYGLTETVGLGACLTPEDHAAGRLRSCGKPCDGVETRVAVDGRIAAVGEVGEIEIRGAAVMKGYWNRPEATAEAIDADGWFRTGDAGYVDAEGYIYIHDRVKDMIVSGGENVYPAEVENALFSHPAVADAAVIGIPDPRWGEAVKAVVVLRPGHTADAPALITHCRSLIAAYKAPKSVDFIAVLPRNPSGKVLRRELRAPYWQGQTRQVG